MNVGRFKTLVGSDFYRSVIIFQYFLSRKKRRTLRSINMCMVKLILRILRIYTNMILTIMSCGMSSGILEF